MFAKKAKCLHEIISSVATEPKGLGRTKNIKPQIKEPKSDKAKHELKPFEQEAKHQEVFDALKHI